MDAPELIPAVVEMPVDAIVIGDRHRKEMGDLKALASSIEDVGLIQPVVIDPDNRLVAGERRLAAVRLLGWESIPVTVIHTLGDAHDRLQAERDENTCRKEMTWSEAAVLAAELEELERGESRRRQVEGGRQGGVSFRPTGQKLTSDTESPGREVLPPPETPRKNGVSLDEYRALPDNEKRKVRRQRETRQVVGDAIGMSGRGYARLRSLHRVASGLTNDAPEVVEAAKQALAEGDRGNLSLTGAEARVEAARDGETREFKGRSHSRKQLKSLEGIDASLAGIAAALEAALQDGFERSVTDASAMGYVRSYRANVRRINCMIAKLEQHITPEREG